LLSIVGKTVSRPASQVLLPGSGFNDFDYSPE